MYYEINVSKLTKAIGRKDRYEHYFATAPRSITYYNNAILILKEFMVLFPQPEYDITISEVPERFDSYSPEKFLLKYDKKK